MRFLYSNLIDTDSYTLSINSEASGYSKENVREYQLSTTYRTTGDSDEWLKVDGGSSEEITANCAFIAGHNISSGATTIKIQGNDTDSWATPTVDESFTHDTGVMWETFTSDDLRYWRWAVADASNSDGYIEMGRVGLGTYFTTTEEAAAGFTRRIVDTSSYTRSITGEIYGDEGITYIEYDFQFPVLTDTDRTNMETMWETVKSVKPIILIPTENDSTLDPLYCVITRFEITHRIGLELWSCNLSVAEAK